MSKATAPNPRRVSSHCRRDCGGPGCHSAGVGRTSGSRLRLYAIATFQMRGQRQDAGDAREVDDHGRTASRTASNPATLLPWQIAGLGDPHVLPGMCSQFTNSLQMPGCISPIKPQKPPRECGPSSHFHDQSRLSAVLALRHETLCRKPRRNSRMILSDCSRKAALLEPTKKGSQTTREEPDVVVTQWRRR